MANTQRISTLSFYYFCIDIENYFSNILSDFIMKDRITELFGIQYPIIQGGMIWCSGWRLASAVSNAGGLGLIGGGSMRPELFKEHIQKCKAATNKPFGVNIPLLYPHSEEQILVALEEGVKIFFTSAGNPKKYTAFLKEKGAMVVHVVANLKFALKSQEAGVDAVVVEGFEAGGHNGKEETTTLVLLQHLAGKLNIPLIAAGGIGSGKAIFAALAMGADGVQIGSLFAASQESSAHENFKTEIIKANEGDTKLKMKSLVPVRLLRNPFADKIEEMENAGESNEKIAEFLGKGRAMKGMFEGDLIEGELEIGQVSSLISNTKSALEIINALVEDYKKSYFRMFEIKP